MVQLVKPELKFYKLEFMAKKYEKEFKLMIVDLLQSGQTAVQVSRDYGLNESMIRRWRKEKESGKQTFTGKVNFSLSPY